MNDQKNDTLSKTNTKIDVPLAAIISAGVAFFCGTVAAVTAWKCDASYHNTFVEEFRQDFKYYARYNASKLPELMKQLSEKHLLSCGAMPWEASVALIGIGSAVVAGLLTFAAIQLYNKLSEEKAESNTTKVL